MKDALLANDTLMHFQADPYIYFMNARGKCSANKAFMRATKAAGLMPPK